MILLLYFFLPRKCYFFLRSECGRTFGELSAAAELENRANSGSRSAVCCQLVCQHFRKLNISI